MQDKEKRQLLSAITFVSSVGATIISNLAVGYFIGKWLDGKLESSPTATMIGIVVGMVTGVWSIYKWIVRDYIKG